MAHIFASTTGSDADWIVKLIDVYPESYPEKWDLAGYQLMVSNEVFRGRYRNGIEKPSAIVPGKVEEYAFSLHTQNYTFRKGHRIMVQVQSTWFPIIDRNPQTSTRRPSSGAGPGLHEGDAPRLPIGALPFARRRAGCSRTVSSRRRTCSPTISSGWLGCSSTLKRSPSTVRA